MYRNFLVFFPARQSPVDRVLGACWALKFAVLLLRLVFCIRSYCETIETDLERVFALQTEICVRVVLRYA